MQIRCTSCTRTLGIAADGALPAACPHCAGACVPPQLGADVPERLLATGGMGEVYLARHAELGTEVALKLLPAMPLDAAAAVRERFAREARLTARVQHPGVVKVLASEVEGDRPFLVLEFVAGETLRQRLLRAPLGLVEAARGAASTADVLAAAHAQGVLHRDIKPDNVMVTSTGDVRVLDFGIARAIGDEAPLTRTGEIVGTPEYMAPEQLLDGPEATDQRTDVHALGLLLYELLTQRSPFRGANLFQTLKLVESLVPPPPSSLRAEVPQALDAVVQRALQKQAADRYATAADFAAAVRAAVPAAALPPRPAPARRWPWLLIGAFAGLLTTAALVLLWLVPLLLTAVGLAVVPHIGQIAVTVHPALSLRAALDAELASGQWAAALVTADRAHAAGDRAAAADAQDAFLLHHLAWPLAAGLPAWLGCGDEPGRLRRFGGPFETPEPHDPLTAARHLLARSEPQRALAALQNLPEPRPRAVRRLHLLAAHAAAGASAGATADLAALPPQLELVDDPLARLLAVRLLPFPDRAPAFLDLAARLPITGPEHWLARRCAGRGDDDTAQQAWWHGAGELAVLLDAALRVLPAGPAQVLDPLPAAAHTRLRRRVGATDPAASPASPLLVVLLDALQPTTEAPDLEPARTFPAPWHTAAAMSFVDLARARPDRRFALLLLATALGARPDFAQAPWQEVPAADRARLEAEAGRGR